MDIVLFIVFLLTDLLMSVIFIAVYRKKDVYKDGMILAVHIPAEEVENEEVQSIVTSYKKIFKRYNFGNLVAGVAICFLCFINFTVFFILWMIWLLVYIFAGTGVIYYNHYKMYQLKMKKGWVLTQNTHVVHIDTAVSSQNGKLPISHWWQLPVALCYVASFALPAVRSYWSSEATDWIFPATILTTIVLFWGLHLWFSYRKNTVYSMDSSINLSLNRMEKHTWSVLLLTINYLSLFGWLYLVLKIQIANWLSAMDYFIFIGLQMIPAIILMVGIIYITKRKQAILAMDTEPVVVDDDEYWKYGWYSNPNDSSFMVSDRLCSTNYAINMAKPSAKVFMIVSAFIVTASLVFVIILMTLFDHVNVQCTITDNQASFQAVMYHTEIPRKDIESVKILDALPNDDFMRTNGGDSDQYLIGHFSGKKTGKSLMYIYKKYTPILEIKTSDETVYVNSKDKADVEKWYQELEK